MRSTRHDVTANPLGTLKAADRDRYLQVLLARSPARAPLVALFHFNVELARIADHAREPMAGYIRLQWWRDALAGLAAGTAPPHPVLTLLAEGRVLDRVDPACLQALVDAREVELDATPLPGLAQVEAHARATAGALNALVASLAGGDEGHAEAATTVGTAYGLLGVVRAVPFVLQRPQPLLPGELMADAGLSASTLRGGSDATAALRPVLACMVDRAAECLASAPTTAPRALSCAFVPAALARQDLARLRRLDLDVFDARLTDRPPWTTARLIVAAALGRLG